MDIIIHKKLQIAVTQLAASTSNIEKYLLGDGTSGPDVIPDEVGYNVCVWRSSSGSFGITAKQFQEVLVKIDLSATGTYTRTGC
jgi:hypothetical protein